MGLGTGMRGPPRQFHVEFRGRQKARGAADQFVIPRGVDADVRGEEILHAVHHARPDHRQGPAYALFPGLEDEPDVVPQAIPAAGQLKGHPKPDGRVAVVRAGVALARVERGETLPGREMRVLRAFLHVHRVDVEAQGRERGQIRAHVRHKARDPSHPLQPRRACPLLPCGLKTGALHGCVGRPHARRRIGYGVTEKHRIPGPGQLFGQKRRGPEFRKPRFRVTVHVAAEGGKLFLRNGGGKIHVGPPSPGRS